MRLKLTEKEVAHLGWDDCGVLEVIGCEDPELRAVIRKAKRGDELTGREASIFIDEVSLLNTFACDGVSIAKRIIRKAEKLAAAIRSPAG